MKEGKKWSLSQSVLRMVGRDRPGLGTCPASVCHGASWCVTVRGWKRPLTAPGEAGGWQHGPWGREPVTLWHRQAASGRSPQAADGTSLCCLHLPLLRRVSPLEEGETVGAAWLFRGPQAPGDSTVSAVKKCQQGPCRSLKRRVLDLPECSPVTLQLLSARVCRGWGPSRPAGRMEEKSVCPG